MGKEENKVKTDIEEMLLKLGFDPISFWRNQTFEGTINGRRSQSGKSGLTDISLVLADGRTLYIEVKRPDEKSAFDRLNTDQLKFAAFCVKNNVPFVAVQSASELFDYLKTIQARAHVKNMLIKGFEI